MNSFWDYLIDYIRYKLSLVLGGMKNYESWKSKSYSLKKVEIKNKKLAKEIEDACQKHGGFLTYSQFLDYDQFGKNGYHATHSIHGITPTHNAWGKALLALCRKQKISHVLEFGPGVGQLAVEILKEARKNKHEMTWSGIELNKDFHKQIKDRLAKNGFSKNLSEIVTLPSEIKTKKKSLVIFSYCLDSIPPEIFVNTTTKKSFPNSMIGVKVKDGWLEEFLLRSSDLKERGVTFEKGVYVSPEGFSFDLKSWKLHPRQRAYIGIPAFITLTEAANKFNDSTFVIIDEFRPLPFLWETRHLGLPKDLNKFKRDVENLEKAYMESGKNLFYYPSFFITFYKFLNSLGFRSVKHEIEQKMAKDLVDKRWISVKNYLTFAFLAQNKSKNKTTQFRIDFPNQKII